jgi:hypothetical protein
MSKLTTSLNQPKVKLLIETLNTEDKLRIMEEKKKQREKAKEKKTK